LHSYDPRRPVATNKQLQWICEPRRRRAASASFHSAHAARSKSQRAAVNCGVMRHSALSPCPGCGALFPPHDGPTHRYPRCFGWLLGAV
jgi:hypothetical protein